MEDEIKNAFNKGKIEGYNERSKEIHKKEIRKDNFKKNLNKFMQNTSPLIFFLGIIGCITGIWIEPHFSIIATSLIVSFIGIFMKYVEV